MTASFLREVADLRPLTIGDARGMKPSGLALGQGAQPLEVAILESHGRPSLSDLRAIWKTRLGGRATPLLVVALYGDRAALCGPSGDQPPAFPDLEQTKVERLCAAALAEPDRHAALRFLLTAIPELEAPISGLRNEGLFTTHELEWGVPRRPDWSKAVKQAGGILNQRGQTLLKGLGFTIEPLPGPASILRAAGTKMAVAVLLERNESPDTASERFTGKSPVSYALAKADQENLPYVMVSAGPLLRLYPTGMGIGVGRRGRTETYIEVRLDLLDADKAGYLDLIFSARALGTGGSFNEILDASRDFAVELGGRLRTRVYEAVVPRLAQAILESREAQPLTTDTLRRAYKMTLTVLFRLLFIAYAEDKDLLPYRSNQLYRSRSLKQKAKELLKIIEAGTTWTDASTHWEDVRHLFRAVDKGNPEWGVPAYNGGLFSSDDEQGAAIESLSLKNDRFGPLLAELLLDRTPEGSGPVDFRSLGVREFGTIYEGLLEQELAVAPADLTTAGEEGIYRPVRRKADKVIVHKSEAYLQTRSGARKATGSFFTKDFAVDHLLDHALEPALREHCGRLDTLRDDRAAADAFFDFRVADLAMGSGHFLVSAVDRIERGLTGYLARRPLPDVSAELHRLRAAAKKALGPAGEGAEIEDTLLLRRQIARRCIFGVDLNPLAVQLSRLSIWVHTFVPGLPLSFLDHNLVEGNSLVGIATVQEVTGELKDAGLPLFPFSAESLVGPARKAIERLGRLADADKAEIDAAREAMSDARAQVAPAEALFDILAAARIDEELRAWVNQQALRLTDKLAGLPGSPTHHKARRVLTGAPPFHFPVIFPEVFLRKRAGFDVILGNPPWEEATVEEDRFWTRYSPGLHSLPQHEQEEVKRKLRRERPDLVKLYDEENGKAELLRRLLINGPFAGMGTGDPDLYKAFAWRFLQLVAADGGRIGVVLPRNAFSAKGSAEFRLSIFETAQYSDLTTLVNSRGWVFEDVHPQYTIALVSIEKRRPGDDAVIPLRGPFRDHVQYKEGMLEDPCRFLVRDAMSWTDTAALPLLPSADSGAVFEQLHKSPRLDFDDKKSWLARPYAELHATNDKHLMKLIAEQPEGYWPVFKGESFDLWEPDTGTYYAWADPETMQPALQAKRLRARSAFDGFSPVWLRDPKTLPCLEARVAFRDVSRATDSRTLRAALVPPKVFITNTAPYLLLPRGDERDQAYLLGILSSIPLDWYARRFVEIHMNFFIFGTLPVPRPTPDDPLRRRVIELAGRLACPDRRFGRWAKVVGVECGKLPDDEKQDMIFELDAVVARLYGLSVAQLRHIFETFHEGWDFEERLRGVLRHFETWKKKS